MVDFRAAAEGFSDLFSRARLARALGLSFDGKRNYDSAFGYPDLISVAEYKREYERGGIAGAVVDALPKATWRGGCDLYENQDPETSTEFETSWKLLADRLNVVPILESADILSGLSTYAVLVIGAVGDSTQELPKATKGQEDVLYLRQYLGEGGPSAATQSRIGVQARGATIKELVTNSEDPRYGQPLLYTVKTGDTSKSTIDVHYSRIIHLAESPLEDPLYAAPRLERVWNDLLDLKKIKGGGSEAFFQRANGGRVWSIDKDVKELEPEEKAAFKEQIEELQHNVIKDIRARGLTVQQLGSDVANFSGPQDAVITLIAGATRIPKRILTGSEMGELASSQDRDNWRDQVNGRRQQYAYPFVLKRLVDRLIEYGYLPTPAKALTPKWGAVMNLTRDERNSIISAWTAAKTDEGQLFTNAEIRDAAEEMEPLTDDQKQEIADALDVKAERAAANKPALAYGAFPRAAASGDELVDVLEAAIEADSPETVLAILGFNADQPRDEQGRWAPEGATTVRDVESRISSLIGNKSARKKMTIDALASMPKERLQHLHDAYSRGAEIATGNAKHGYSATKRAIEFFLKDAK